MSRRIFSLLILLALTACAATHRSNNAEAAKTQMLGMSREDVLTCMGPAKKKAHEGATEVWSYQSTDGQGNNQSETQKIGNTSLHNGSHDKNSCTVNVVMKEGIVTRINYIGNSGSMFAPYDQCGYAIANCINGNETGF